MISIKMVGLDLFIVAFQYSPSHLRKIEYRVVITKNIIYYFLFCEYSCSVLIKNIIYPHKKIYLRKKIHKNK